MRYESWTMTREGWAASAAFQSDISFRVKGFPIHRFPFREKIWRVFVPAAAARSTAR